MSQANVFFSHTLKLTKDFYYSILSMYTSRGIDYRKSKPLKFVRK